VGADTVVVAADPLGTCSDFNQPDRGQVLAAPSKVLGTAASNSKTRHQQPAYSHVAACTAGCHPCGMGSLKPRHDCTQDIYHKSHTHTL
jgi:hypothetical protein